MNRKVFVSFLGTTNYGPCDYHHDNRSYGKSRFAQEVTLNYLMQSEEWSDADAAYILMTKDSEIKNWNDGFYRDRQTQEPLTGLETCLRQMALPFPVTPVKELPDGNNEEEIWQIFQRVFSECIQEGDTLYFDITHGYRYLPMLIVVLGNYAKFLKNITVGGISYCNYEISNWGTKPGLIVDLMPLSTLQDWTYASGQYIRSGDASTLVKLADEVVRPMMKKHKGQDNNTNNLYAFVKSLDSLTKELRTCRGSELITAKTLKRLSQSCRSIDATVIPQLDPLIGKIQESLTSFSLDEDIRNGFAAVDWCFDHGLYQQAATLLEESIITLLCGQVNLDWMNRTHRDLASAAIYVQSHPDEPLKEQYHDQQTTIHSIQATPGFAALCSVYTPLSGLRNDFNHAGMRTSHSKPDDIVTKLQNYIDTIKSTIKL